MNICEGSFYESRDGEGYVYVKERDYDDISFIACSEPTEKALSDPDAYIGNTTKSEFEKKIVYPFCECKGYTAWADVPMDIHEECEIMDRINTIRESGYPSKEVKELCNIVSGILDRGSVDEYEDEEDEA